MRQLTSLDAQFLAVESARVYGHVAFLGIYDPSTAPGGRLDMESVTELLSERLHLLPPLRWRLASDSYDRNLPAGYSSHADWFNGWDPEIMKTFVELCDRRSVDCHGNLLGDGRELI